MAGWLGQHNYFTAATHDVSPHTHHVVAAFTCPAVAAGSGQVRFQNVDAMYGITGRRFILCMLMLENKHQTNIKVGQNLRTASEASRCVSSWTTAYGVHYNGIRSVCMLADV